MSNKPQLNTPAERKLHLDSKILQCQAFHLPFCRILFVTQLTNKFLGMGRKSTKSNLRGARKKGPFSVFTDNSRPSEANFSAKIHIFYQLFSVIFKRVERKKYQFGFFFHYILLLRLFLWPYFARSWLVHFLSSMSALRLEWILHLISSFF